MGAVLHISLFKLCEFCEVLDGSNHLAGVGVFVIVPCNNLYLVGFFVDLGNHRLGSIEQRAVGDAHHVGRYDLIFVVAVVPLHLGGRTCTPHNQR